ncbi:MAG: phytanoyl-CoA dioxygenase family protein [Polyangiaceae bacterium]
MLDASASSIDLDGVLRHFEEHGYARVGKIASDETLTLLRDRTNAIMMGEVTYEGLFFQLDNQTGNYEELVFGRGWEGPSLNYRKIEKLEKDPLFRAWLENPIFERIARARIDGDVTIYRALIMNKAERGGTHLPWHQDGGLFWGLDKDPTLQVWTALDDAPVEAGCIEVVPGSHTRGLATPLGGVVPKDRVEEADVDHRIVALPVRAGEVLLLHNHLWHRSGVNVTGHPRRAFTVCYMDAKTRCQRKKKAPRSFTRVFAR